MNGTRPHAGIEVDPAMQGWKNKARQVALNRVARVMSGELEKIGTPVKRVIVDARGRACTDGETVWIPMQMTDDEVLNLAMQEAILAHEAAGHLRYTDFKAWKKVCDGIKAGDEDRMLHDFVNILEDARVNYLLSQDFPGSGKRLDATQEHFMQKHEEMWAEKSADEINPRQAAMVAMMSEAIAHTPHFFNHVPEVVAYMDEVREICTNAIAQPNTASVIVQAKRMMTIYRTHFPEDYSEDADTFGMPSGEAGEGICTDDMSPEEIEKMAEKQKDAGAEVEEAPRRRFKELKEKMDEVAEKAQKAKEDAQNAQESEESGSGSEGTEEAEESAEGDGEGQDGEGSEGDSESGDSGSGDADGEGDSADGEGEGEGDASGDSGDSSDSADSGSSTGPQEGTTEDELTESSSDSDTMEAGGGRGADLTQTDDLWAEIQEALDAEAQEAYDLRENFAEQIEKTMNADDFPETIENDSNHSIHITHTTQSFIERGDVHVAHYAQSYNEVVFQNKVAITTLVNEMKRLIKGSDSKFVRGLKKGALDTRRVWMHKTNDRLFQKRQDPQKADANVVVLIDSSGSMSGTRAEEAAKTAVIFAEVFDRLGFGCEIVDFASRGDTAIRIRKSMNAPVNEITKAAIACPTAGGSNADGYAVEWCINRVKDMKGTSMVFVISDGQPAGPAPPNMDCDTHLKTVVANCPKSVALFSVGIDGMDTSEYYDNAVCVDDARNLVKQSLPIIRKMCRRIAA